jgi:HK97 family phage portal protein
MLDAIARWFVDDTDVQARSDYPSWETQIAAFHRLPQPWSIASPDEAMTVPAIFRAVTLIANTVGMLNLETFRNKVLLTDPADIPRLTMRPNPRSTPRAFWRDTGYYMATRGESWWWIAKRDIDNNPVSLFPVPPWEIVVEANPRDRLKPRITWLDREMDNDDMRQITYMPDRDGLRGVGPLQMCGAAVSVAVEAQEWAANFFSGSVPSIVGETEMDLTETEAKALDDQWAEKPGNLPRWLPNGLKVRDFGFDPNKAQLIEQRRFNDGQAAVMFGIPGSLLEYAMPGSSLTYQNVEGEYTKFVRTCLQPNYLEPIEQEMSDLLTRSHTVRFNTNEVQRADMKSRSEVFKNLTESGIAPEVAGQIVGFETLDPNPSNVAPIPAAPPQAIPNLLPPDIRSARVSGEVRCSSCHKLLAETLTPPYRMTCPRCKTVSEDLQVRTSHEVPQPVINVHPAPITFARGAVQVDAPDMSGVAALAERPPAPTNVSISTPPDDTLIEAIAELREKIATPRVRRIERDENGLMIRLIEESA